jgi:hypothetical protein
MARAHALIIAEADGASSPVEVLRMVNKHITRLEKSTQFVTALYGVLDTRTGEFSYARAGHEPPLLLHEHSDVHRLPHKPGMALGLWEDIALDDYSLFLPRNSLLVLFTDGMTDCRNPKGEPFGLDRIKKTMASQQAKTAQESCDQLFDALMDYQNGSKQDPACDPREMTRGGFKNPGLSNDPPAKRNTSRAVRLVDHVNIPRGPAANLRDRTGDRFDLTFHFSLRRHPGFYH